MANSAFIDVILRAADDEDFRRRLVAKPDSIGRVHRLGRQEQRMIDAMSAYAVRREPRAPFDDVEFADLLAVFVKLAVQDAANDPDVIGRLQDLAGELRRRANELELERLDEMARERDETAACASLSKVLAWISLAVILVVLLEQLFNESADPERRPHE